MIFLDIEASGLQGYPIEIGLAFVTAKRTIVTHSMLIRHDEWLNDETRWDECAESLHGITRDQLRHCGRPPQEVIGWLLSHVSGHIVLVDSNYDQLWLNELFAATGRSEITEFHLAGMPFCFHGPEIDPEKLDVLADIFNAEQHPHRAAPDAARWAQLYIDSLRDNEPPRRIVVENDWIRRVVVG